jgi:hypothetical protein
MQSSHRLGWSLFGLELVALCVLTAMLLSSCGRAGERIAPHLEYFRDPRTGLCFAVHSGDYRLFTWVPCAPALKLIPFEVRP